MTGSNYPDLKNIENCIRLSTEGQEIFADALITPPIANKELSDDLMHYKNLNYPVAIWKENGTFTAEIPSLPGVVTEADSLPELEKSLKEAALGWIEAELAAGRSIPKPESMEMLEKNPAYEGCSWIFLDIDTKS